MALTSGRNEVFSSSGRKGWNHSSSLRPISKKLSVRSHCLEPLFVADAVSAARLPTTGVSFGGWHVPTWREPEARERTRRGGEVGTSGLVEPALTAQFDPEQSSKFQPISTFEVGQGRKRY